MQLAPGDRIDRYQLIEPLGEGGQGSVWKAVDALDPTRTIALKLVPILHAKPNQLERVRREARGLAKLEHPSLVKCHGLFEDFKLSVLGLVLDVVDGVSLADALDDPRLIPKLRWVVLDHIANALAHLHEHRVIHRDLKPENVVLSAQFWSSPGDARTVKLIDFGIAVEEGDPSRLTAYGSVIGTPAYMAPELIDATHLKRRELTPAIDVFAFGILAWRMMVGGHPTGLAPESTVVDYAVIYRKVTTGERAWIAPGSGLAYVITACIEPHPANRLQTGGQIVGAFAEARSTAARTTRPAVSPSAQSQTEEAGPAPGLFQNPGVSTLTANTIPSPAVRARSRAPQRKSGLLWIGVVIVALGFVGVVMLGGLGAWFFFHDESATENPANPPTTKPPPRKADSPKRSAAIPAPSESINGVVKCCPSGRDCGGTCSELIPTGEVVRLRPAYMIEKGAKDASLSGIRARYPEAQFCFGLASSAVAPKCVKLADLSKPVSTEYLDVTVAELGNPGLRVSVVDGTRELASAVKRGGNLQRRVLCEGRMFGEFGGIVEIGSFLFYLDAPTKTDPQRCL